MSLKNWFNRYFDPYPDMERDIARAEEEYAARQRLFSLHADAPLLKPKPKLATVRNAPSRDEFAAWRQDPTTAFVMAALLRNAVECEDKWFIDSWEAGKADQRTLDGLRERADALRGIAEADYEAFCETLGLEPEPLHGDAA